MTDHYYSENPKSDSEIKKIKQKILGKDFEFFTSSGVFSKDHIDIGTITLCENMLIEREAKVLDIGCGIGVLGIVACKIFDANVIMTDINKRAVMLSKKNLGLNKAEGIVLQGDLFEKIKNNDFDDVLSNPPQHAGKELCFKLIEESKNYLKPKGNLQIVARHTKGGKTLSLKMKEVFANVEVIGRKSGFTVYRSVKFS